MAINDKERLKVLTELRSFKLKLPDHWTFNRDEANARFDENANVVPLPDSPNPRRHS